MTLKNYLSSPLNFSLLVWLKLCISERAFMFIQTEMPAWLEITELIWLCQSECYDYQFNDLKLLGFHCWDYIKYKPSWCYSERDIIESK